MEVVQTETQYIKDFYVSNKEMKHEVQKQGSQAPCYRTKGIREVAKTTRGQERRKNEIWRLGTVQIRTRNANQRDQRRRLFPISIPWIYEEAPTTTNNGSWTTDFRLNKVEKSRGRRREMRDNCFVLCYKSLYL